MRIGSRWVKYQQIALLNVKSAIHHLIPSKDLKSMENMLHTEGKAVVGNNICLSPFCYTCLYHLRNGIFQVTALTLRFQTVQKSPYTISKSCCILIDRFYQVYCNFDSRYLLSTFQDLRNLKQLYQ
jgi:hypothetical protein